MKTTCFISGGLSASQGKENMSALCCYWCFLLNCRFAIIVVLSSCFSVKARRIHAAKTRKVQTSLGRFEKELPWLRCLSLWIIFNISEDINMLLYGYFSLFKNSKMAGQTRPSVDWLFRFMFKKMEWLPVP